jgi:lysophospholipase L1-like esterase
MAERLGLLQPAQKIHDDPAAEASRALRTLASRVKESGAALGVLRYWQRHEMAAASAAGLDRLSTMLLDENIRCWDSAAAGPAPAPPGFTDDPRLFLPGDNAHPSAAGQARMAECLRGMVIELLDADSGSGRILGPAGLSPGPPSRRRAL